MMLHRSRSSTLVWLCSLALMMLSRHPAVVVAAADDDGPLAFVRSKFDALDDKGKFIAGAAAGFVGSRIVVGSAMKVVKIGAAAFIAAEILDQTGIIDYHDVIEDHYDTLTKKDCANGIESPKCAILHGQTAHGIAGFGGRFCLHMLQHTKESKAPRSECRVYSLTTVGYLATCRSGNAECILEREGMSLIEVFGLDYVDAKRIFSHHIVEISTVLGIKAARKTIISEICNAISVVRSNMNYRQLACIADVIAHLKDTSDALTEAAMFTEEEQFEEITQKIILAASGS
eukprot:scaffold4097_cov166-Amphora_coffeaeformis.AAC.43